VKDKRYWMSLMQSKTQEILQETERLKREKKNLDRETSARKLYEKKVKEQAKELSSNFLINFVSLSQKMNGD
jgi:intraflagellar transport protein 74